MDGEEGVSAGDMKHLATIDPSFFRREKSGALL